MNEQLEQYLREMRKEDFRDILRKLAIDVKANDTDTLSQEERYKLYKTELEQKFAEIDIQITTVDDLRKLQEASSLQEFRNEIARHNADVMAAFTSNERIDANNERPDNTGDLEKIHQGIVELKAMVSELNAMIDDFHANKRFWSESEKTAKQKEIDEKKAAIEAKKKEIQELIDKVKKAWRDITFDEITDPTIKEELKRQKEEEEKKLMGFQKELDGIFVPSSNFGERIRNVRNKTWQWAKKNPRTAGGILVGGGLILGWMFGLFKRRKKKEASEHSEEENSNRKEKSRFGRNWWKLLLGGIGIRGIRKLLFSKKYDEHAGAGTEVPGTLRNIENGVKSFEKIDNPETKNNLNKVGISVNEFFTEIYTFNDNTIPQGVDTVKLGNPDLDKYPGVIPHIIDNSFSTIDSFVSQSGLMRLSVDATADDIIKMFGDMIAKGLENLVGFILGTIGFKGTKVNMEQVRAFISGSNKKEDIIKIRQMIYKTFTYVNYAENTYIRKKIYEKIVAGNALWKRDSEEGTWKVVTISNPDDLLNGDLFAKIESNPENYKIDEISIADIKSEFRGKKLRDIPILGITNADIKKYNKSLYDKIDEYNQERDVRQREVVSNKNATLEKLGKNADAQLQDSFWQSVRRNVPLFHLFGGDETRAKNAFKEMAGYKELLATYQQKFEKLKTETDMNKIKYEIDMYYVTLKELATMEYAIGEAIDENGNVGVSLIGRFTAFSGGSINNIVVGFNQIVNADGVGDVMMGVFNIGTGAGSLYVVYHAIRYPKRSLIFTLRSIGTILGTTGSLMGRHLPINLIPDARLKKFYLQNPKYLAYDYAKGNITTEKANRILKKMNQNNGNIFDFLKGQGIFGQTNSDEIATLLNRNKEFLENYRIRKDLFDRHYKRSKWLTRKDRVVIEIEHSIYMKLKNIDATLSAINDPMKTKFCKEIIKNAEFDDTAAFLGKMNDYIKSDAFKNLDISNMTNVEIENLGKNIGKNIRNLNSVDEISNYINTLIRHVSSVVDDSVDLIDEASTKKLIQLIDEELNIIRNRLTSMGTEANPGPTFSRVRMNYYQKAIEHLETFKANVRQLNKTEYGVISSFIDNGFDVGSMAKLYSILTHDVPGAQTIKGAMEVGDITLLKSCLKDVPQEEGFKNIVTKQDIDDIIRQLELFERQTGRLGNIDELLQSMSKLFVKMFTTLT